MKLTPALLARTRFSRPLIADRIGPARLFVVSLWAVAAGLVFGAAPLAGWADALPDFPGVPMVSEAAQGWYDITRRLGLDAPYEAIRSAVRAAQAARTG